MRTIQIGNDELILYFRKNYPKCKIKNADLGKKIWLWIKDEDRKSKKIGDEPCFWGNSGSFIGENLLPKTATQFILNSRILPDLYNYLDELGDLYK